MTEQQTPFEVPKNNLIYSRIAAISKEIGAIGKNKRNEQQKFMFRGIDDVYNALQPLLAKHGVFTVPQVQEDRTEERQSKAGGNLIYRVLKMRYDFYADDGSSVWCTVIGEGMDSGDKAANKAMAIAHKYALLQTFCIPTEDMKDPDSESHEASISLREQWEIKAREVCEAAQTLEDIIKWWPDNGPTIKKELNKADAAKIYNLWVDRKNELKAAERQPGEEG